MTARDGNLLGSHGTSFLNLTQGDSIAFDNNAKAFLNRPAVKMSVIPPTTAALLIDWANNDLIYFTDIAQTTSIDVMLGTPFAGQSLKIYIEDNGTPAILSWNTSAGGFRAFAGITLPLLTTASKSYYFDMVYNAQDGFWDVLYSNSLAVA